MRTRMTPTGRRRGLPLAVALVASLVPSLAALGAPAPLLAPAAPAPPVDPAPPAAPLPPPPGTTSRVSVAANGAQANQASAVAGISGDGKWVAFSSQATNLVANDTNNVIDIFVKNVETGAIQRVPFPAGFTPVTGATAAYPSFSTDGEWLAFTYLPSTGTTTDGPVPSRIFLWQRSRNVTVEINPTQLPTNARMNAAISPDGLFVAYDGIPSTNSTSFTRQVYLWSRATNSVVLVSANTIGQPGAGGASYSPSVANGGKVVVFHSTAIRMTQSSDNNPGADLLVRDVAAGQTGLLSPVAQPPVGTTAPEYRNEGARISADGRFVAWATDARYSPLDTNNAPDVYRFDREAGTYDLVSVDASGKAAAGYSYTPAITPTGRYVAFTSDATTIIETPIPGATGPITGVFAGPRPVPTTEVYIREMITPETIRASVTTNGAAAGSSLRPVISDDGGRVAWDSTATNLATGDTNQVLDVFLRDIPGILTATPTPVDFGAYAVGTSSLPAAVTLGNDGWADLRVTGLALAGASPGDFKVLADPCSGNLLIRGGKCSVAVGYSPTAAGTRTGQLNVGNTTVRAPVVVVRLTGRASDAKLELSEEIGSRGRVVTATGAGFPAGATVKLRWSMGVTPSLPKIVADAKGGFRIQVLVFHHDPLGARKLIAEPVAGSAQFLPAEADYLVTEAPGVPPVFNLPGPLPNSIITRR